VKLLERACDEGQHADACFAIGDLARDGKLVAGGEAVTKARFERAFTISFARCDLADSGGCGELLLYLGADVMPDDRARSALEVTEAVCRRGDAFLCMDLAQTLKRGRFADEQRAKRAFDQACSLGHPACAKEGRAAP
jgi:TPR repeat protein